MYFSKESRYRNLGAVRPTRRPPPPPYLIPVVIGVVLVCCVCGGAVVAYEFLGSSLPNPLAAAAQPRPTPTLDKTVPVPFRTAVRAENGLELKVTALERPLRVEGLANMPANQQFVLVSLTARNAKTSGDPIPLNPQDFRVKGDGGLSYDANPKSVTIDTLLTADDAVAPGKSIDRDLIFQIAKDDSGLMLYWTVGSTTRMFILEP